MIREHMKRRGKKDVKCNGVVYENGGLVFSDEKEDLLKRKKNEQVITKGNNED